MLSSRAKSILAAFCAISGFVFLLVFTVCLSRHGDNVAQTSAIRHSLLRALPRLESYVYRPNAKIPDEMVVYQYRNGELIHWRNMFPVRDDPAMLYFTSTEFKLHFLSGQPYLVRRVDRENGDCFVIGYAIHTDCQVFPPNYFGGHPVVYRGRVMFKVFFPDKLTGSFPEFKYIWIAYILLIVAVLLFLLAEPDIRRMCLSMVTILMLSAALYSVLRYLPGSEGFRTLATVPLLNILIFSLSSCVSISREDLSYRFPITGIFWKSAISFFLIGTILLYIHLSIRHLMLDTDLEMAFINLPEMTLLGILIALSYFLSLSVIAMIIRFGFRRMTVWEQVGLSLVVSTYLVFLASWYSFVEESKNLKVSSAALALNRDMNLEALLMRNERQIQNDTLLVRAAFGAVDLPVAEYVAETYLSEMSSKYDVTAYVANLGEVRFLKEMRKNMVRIAADSRFYQVQEVPGSRYVAVFPFYQGTRVRNIVIMLDNKALLSSVRQTDLPPKYSYARYHDGKLVNFRGQFAYPTIISEGLSDYARFRHFIFDFGNNDQIVVSRKRVAPGRYVSAIIFSSLLYFFFIFLSGGGEKFVLFRQKSYFERNILRISEILVMTTVLVIFGIIVFFIYGSNKGVMETLVAEKIGILQSAVQDNLGYVSTTVDLVGPQAVQALEIVSKCTESVLTVYSVAGQMILTTRQPSVTSVPPYRMPEEAKSEIIDKHRRYFISRNPKAPVTQYEMYAPLFGIDGEVIGILRSPYIGVETWELETDSVMHVISLISFFIFLTVFARYISERFYHRLIGPLNLLSGKMMDARLDKVEHVVYDRQDEIRGIIDSYNLMVDRLESSTRQLAEAERNQAWTGMARQVAHEIKNPLTPMKLQIQRVMRLKAKGDPSWQEKLEEAAGVMLEHIDVLTQTADDFSSFAKLYSEEFVKVDLDRLLRREIAMYDCHENIDIDFRSSGPAYTFVPKPQLTRVFVNLMTNAIQSVEAQSDGEVKKICIVLSVCDDGRWYDISFHDSGSGVPEENLDKLFVPNFTTKSGGSGLGLAISKSILENCGATISYSRSGILGGACFSVRYPVKES